MLLSSVVNLVNQCAATKIYVHGVVKVSVFFFLKESMFFHDYFVLLVNSVLRSWLDFVDIFLLESIDRYAIVWFLSS